MIMGNVEWRMFERHFIQFTFVNETGWVHGFAFHVHFLVSGTQGIRNSFCCIWNFLIVINGAFSKLIAFGVSLYLL